MAEKKNKSDFNAMNVAELKKYLQERGVSVSGYLKTSLVEIASAVERMVLAVDPNFEKDQTNDADKLIIHDMLIPNPFSLKTVNNFNSSPPFGLYDIFNYLIYHSTDYDKQGLAAYTCYTLPHVHALTLFFNFTENQLKAFLCHTYKISKKSEKQNQVTKCNIVQKPGV